LGYWTGCHEDAFVGWWGLGACSWDTRTANLGYRLLPSYWGRGFATEGSAALLHNAFGAALLDSVWASATQQNLASQRVLTKLSMRYLGIQHEQCQYKIASAEWSAAANPENQASSVPGADRNPSGALRVACGHSRLTRSKVASLGWYDSST
jgi:RimJ/RimL family protein N-acetyltransferase